MLSTVDPDFLLSKLSSCKGRVQIPKTLSQINFSRALIFQELLTYVQGPPRNILHPAHDSSEMKVLEHLCSGSLKHVHKSSAPEHTLGAWVLELGQSRASECAALHCAS